MSILVFLLVALAVLGGLAGVLVLPLGRWSFSYEGRAIEVRNYVLSERITVDGEQVARTRVGGNHLNYAVHALALPDGRQLDVAVTSDGYTFRCRATVGDQVVYDSLAVVPRAGPARARLPEAKSAPPVAGIPTDARWGAAEVLLRELADDPEVRASAGTLSTELRAAMLRLEQARLAAEAHASLGGGDEAAALIEARESAVEELLALLRELHLAASGRSEVQPPPRDAEDALQRLEAEREVDRLRRAARAVRER
ncbi:MAG: hypothetical protein R3F59_10765 [Myxococcota bacterium]